MLVIKVGMDSERELVERRAAADNVLVIGGQHTIDELDKIVPRDCNAIISVGTCGALAPRIKVGDIFVCDILFTPDRHGNSFHFLADEAWRDRLIRALGVNVKSWRWWSSGEAVLTAQARELLYRRYCCGIVDQETITVAQLAFRRGIPFQALRSVSDAADTDLPDATRVAIRKDGSTDLGAVMRSMTINPFQIPALIKTAYNFKKSMRALDAALTKVGPDMLAPIRRGSSEVEQLFRKQTVVGSNPSLGSK